MRHNLVGLAAGACRGEAALADAVIRAVQTLLDRDAYVLWADVSEPTIAHRLAIYLEREFVDWDVDCEYHRDGHNPKEIAFGSGDDADHGSRMFPDVIVHRRGAANNCVVSALKKANNPESDDRDFEELRGYCHQLGYGHGVFVRLVGRSQEPSVARAEFVKCLMPGLAEGAVRQARLMSTLRQRPVDVC